MTTDTKRKKKKSVELTRKFTPQFWNELDGRLGIYKLIRERTERLANDTGADSEQKKMLVQRAVFISLQLETMEVEGAREGKFDPGVYTQMVNSLSGLLTKLGLDKQDLEIPTLEAYVVGTRK